MKVNTLELNENIEFISRETEIIKKNEMEIL